jgi:chromate transporter
MRKTRGGLIAGVRAAGRHRLDGAQLDLGILGNVNVVAGFFFGLKAAVLAVVIEAVHRIGRRAE